MKIEFFAKFSEYTDGEARLTMIRTRIPMIVCSMKTLICPLLLAVSALLLLPPEAVEAGPRQIAYYDNNGRAVYKERIISGRTRYGRPVYSWRIIRPPAVNQRRVVVQRPTSPQRRTTQRIQQQQPSRFPSHVNNTRFLQNHPNYAKSHVRVPTRQPQAKAPVRRPTTTAPVRRPTAPRSTVRR